MPFSDDFIVLVKDFIIFDRHVVIAIIIHGLLAFLDDLGLGLRSQRLPLTVIEVLLECTFFGLPTPLGQKRCALCNNIYKWDSTDGGAITKNGDVKCPCFREEGLHLLLPVGFVKRIKVPPPNIIPAGSPI